MSIQIKNAWVNINTKCNLKCKWCYNRNNFEELSAKDFEMLIKYLKEAGVTSFTIIGGEPTIHREFLDIISILKNDYYVVVTNGLSFSNTKFLNNCVSKGLKRIAYSLKGYDETSFRINSGANYFNKNIFSIKNLQQYPDINVSYDFTVGRELASYFNIHQLDRFLCNYGIESITITDTRPYINKNKVISESSLLLNEIILCNFLDDLKSDYYFRLNHPLCHYPADFIEYLSSRDNLISQCILRKGGGLFFDTRMNMVLCNELMDVIIGEYQKDYIDAQSLLLWINYLNRSDFLCGLTKCPEQKCVSCDNWIFCGGGCLLYWLEKRLMNT